MRRVMIDLFGLHGTHDADIISHAADFWKVFTDFLPGLPEPPELMLWPETD
jgi:hypothetical protein